MLKTFAFHRVHVQHNGTIGLGHFPKHGFQFGQVVPIHRTHGQEAKIREPRVLGHEVFGHFANLVVPTHQRFPAGDGVGHPFGPQLRIQIATVHTYPIQCLGEAALRLGDGHAVVVQHDEHLAIKRARVVEPFHSQAVHNGGVADEGDSAATFRIAFAVVPLAFEGVAAGHTHRGRDARAGVTDTEQIEW